MMCAYATYAVQLTYNGGQGFTTSDGSCSHSNDPNVTIFGPSTVITRGVMSAEVPVTLLILWALMSSSLGVFCGFRGRWSTILDGYTMFRLRAELPDDVNRNFADYSNTLEVDDRIGLSGVPGLVGDTKPKMWLGKIGLIGRSAAENGKMYK